MCFDNMYIFILKEHFLFEIKMCELRENKILKENIIILLSIFS